MSARHVLQSLRAHRLRTALGGTAVGAALAVGVGAMTAHADGTRPTPRPAQSTAAPSPVPSPTKAEPSPVPSATEAQPSPVPSPVKVRPTPAPTKWTSPSAVPSQG